MPDDPGHDWDSNDLPLTPVERALVVACALVVIAALSIAAIF